MGRELRFATIQLYCRLRALISTIRSSEMSCQKPPLDRRRFRNCPTNLGCPSETERHLGSTTYS